MSVIIGIDVGGSSTKIVGFREDEKENQLIEPLYVRAADPLTSLYGAFGKFTVQNNIDLSDIRVVKTTGVGSKMITKPIYGLPSEPVSEFDCIGHGGIYLSGLKEAIVVSLGTGTALIHAVDGKKPEYIGGTGVGGGTLVGLGKQLMGLSDMKLIEEFAKDGDLSRIDWQINSLRKKSGVEAESRPDVNIMTASNFGNVSELATKADLSLGLINMVFETVAMVAMFAARNYNLKDIVLTGYVATLNQAKAIFDKLSIMFDLNFIIPDNAQFSTAIGAALVK